MSIQNRCDGWAQCTKCPRTDGGSPVPPGSDTSKCAPHPVRSCPITGAHCPPMLSCCSKEPGCPISHDCPEFIPSKCSQMPAVNCTPNLPASGWSVTGWKPSPAAYRGCPKTQMPSAPCRGSKPAPGSHSPVKRPCDSRSLAAPSRPLTIWYVPVRPPMPEFRPFPCAPKPEVPTFMTCGGLGSDRLAGRVNFKFSFPGFEGTSSGRYATCLPEVPCFQRVGFRNSGLFQQKPKFKTITVPPSDN